MVNRPSTPEIITVNSESLQEQIRDLLPSQNGFGSELQASNVITPIIDLTATAEGSSLSTDLQTALAFGSITAFEVRNTATTLANATGFWRFYGNIALTSDSAGGRVCTFDITDGSTTKQLFKAQANSVAGGLSNTLFDFIVFLGPGESVSAETDNNAAIISGSYRQVATGNGTLVQPNGFPL